MDAHYWLFPWLSLFASFIAAIGGVLLGRRRSDDSPPPGAISPWLIVAWLASIGLMVLGGLKLGDWAAVDYIPARGVLAGALGGALLSVLIRKRTGSAASKTAAGFGCATALISCAWLWLTHGEVSGLIATVFSTGITLICFVAAPNLKEQGSNFVRRSSMVTVYLTAISAAVLLGFTRAGALGQVYWADIPLMIGAAISVGLLIAAALERFGVIVKTIAVISTTFIVVVPLGISVAHLLPVIGLTILGALTIIIPMPLVDRTRSRELPIYLGIILLIAGITVAFTLLSGYGLALFVLGAITVAAATESDNSITPITWVTFGALLLIYRLEILQNGTSVRAMGPGDLWDLLAIALGVLLPKIITSWIADYTPTISWSAALQWIFAISIPALVLDYIWQPRSLTGLFLGLSIGQLVQSHGVNDHRSELTALTSLLVSLLLFLFLPGLDELTAPSRGVRIAGVVTLAVIAVLRILIHSRRPMAPAKAA